MICVGRGIWMGLHIWMRVVGVDMEGGRGYGWGIWYIF